VQKQHVCLDITQEVCGVCEVVLSHKDQGRGGGGLPCRSGKGG